MNFIVGFGLDFITWSKVSFPISEVSILCLILKFLTLFLNFQIHWWHLLSSIAFLIKLAYTTASVLLLFNYVTNNISHGLYPILSYIISDVFTNAAFEALFIYMLDISMFYWQMIQNHHTMSDMNSTGNFNLQKQVELLYILNN